jgi:ABC-type Fe3+/spermidine/putrescine transport system ATPase subunit
MSEVSLHSVSKQYGGAVAVDNVSLTIAHGEFVTLLGASGSGKTTCLRMVAGFIFPTSGRVTIGARDVTELAPQKRDTAMVFQQYALFPHLTVLENIAFGLSVRRITKADIEKRSKEALDLVQLGEYGHRLPGQLSGGQRQRVALARAVVVRPQILLLDEPLGALDLKLREELQIEIKRIQASLGITTLFVTHDQSEALSMSDRVAVMQGGRIVQIDSPTTIYDQPASQYVARFIGRITLIPVVIASIDAAIIKVVDTSGRHFTSALCSQVVKPGDLASIAIRPEQYRLAGDAANRFEAIVETTSYQGASWTLSCRDRMGISHLVDLPWGTASPRVGETIQISFSENACRVLREDLTT